MDIGRFTSAGNHRTASTRDAGLPMMFAHEVTEEEMKSLYEFVKQEEENGLGTTDMLENTRRQMFRVIDLLIITSHVKDVAPKNSSPLQNVALVRTYVKDDLFGKYINGGRRGDCYGGIHLLWSRMFASMPLNVATYVHFLLDESISDRHCNRMLRGAMHLIETNIPNVAKVAGRPSALDVLLFLENDCAMPDFHISDISNVSQRRARLARIRMKSGRSWSKRSRIIYKTDSSRMLSSPATPPTKSRPCG